MVLSMPGLPDTQLTVDVSSPSPSSPSIRTPRGPDSAGGGDGLLRWRCKEIGCGSAFLTREQLRIHMKTGQHGMGAPLPDSSGADRRTPRMSVPPRQGGYTLRGRSEDDDEMDEDHELPAAVDHQGHQIGAGPHPSNLSSSPTDAPLNPWDADHWHVRSRAQREADQIRRQAMHKAKQERDAEWAEQLEMAQAEVARQKRGGCGCQDQEESRGRGCSTGPGRTSSERGHRQNNGTPREMEKTENCCDRGRGLKTARSLNQASKRFVS